MRRPLVLSIVLVVGLAACGGGTGTAASPSQPAPADWGERDPVVYSVVVAEVLDDLGTAPPVVYVIDAVCAQGGQVKPSELTCDRPIPSAGQRALADQLERYARVEFVDDPDAVTEGDGTVREDGLLFWLGPIKDRKNGEIRVGANYASRVSDEDALGVNLAMENHAGSWIVTGAAGLGGCPA